MKYPKLDKTHNYLGHFKGCLKEGHNTNGSAADEQVKNGGVSGEFVENKNANYKRAKPIIGTRG